MAKKKSRKTHHHGSLRSAYNAAKREYHRAGTALKRATGGHKRKAKHRKGR